MIEDGHHCPFCQSPADKFGDHQVGCGGNRDRIHWHDSLSDALLSAEQSAALVPQKEMPSLVPRSTSRPADIFLLTWERSAAALDITFVPTLQYQTVAGAASVSCYALSVAMERKVAAHLGGCLPVSGSFICSYGGRNIWVLGWSVQSLSSVARRFNALEFHHQTLHDTCSSALPSVFGGEMPAG